MYLKLLLSMKRVKIIYLTILVKYIIFSFWVLFKVLCWFIFKLLLYLTIMVVKMNGKTHWIAINNNGLRAYSIYTELVFIIFSNILKLFWYIYFLRKSPSKAGMNHYRCCATREIQSRMIFFFINYVDS